MISPVDFVNPEIFTAFVTVDPRTQRIAFLAVCSGTVICNFSSGASGPFGGGLVKDTLVFPILKDDKTPLLVKGQLINSVATVALASVHISAGNSTFAVDRAEITQSDAEEGQIFVNADLAIQSGTLLRVTYHVDLLFDTVV